VFLKSLVLKGFKSFADTTTLEFEPGVTVVVGPNGSGKSNIVDAVAWVLGAQGPRVLRSSKMEDVIFAGTPKRPPLGRAEVSLTIDNSAGLLPIDFSEVRITRVLWRSGESEYAINGAPCRLLDVQELLSDTGLGRQQHTIVSQSQLDSILSARPEDRRAVIEEAAGVSKHRRRREKAQRRLDGTESALVRAQDLLREVRHQLRPLERQAEAASRHEQLASELVSLRRYLFGRELASLQARLEGVVSARAELSRSESEILSELSRLDASVIAAEAELDAAQRDMDATDLAEAVSVAEGLKARALGLVALLEERARGIERQRMAAVDQDVVATLEAEAASLKEQLEEADRDALALLPLEAQLAEAEADLAGGKTGPAGGGTAETGAGVGGTAGTGAGGGGAFEDGLAGAGARARQQEPADGQDLAGVRAEIAALCRSTGLAEVELRRLAARAEALGVRTARLRGEVARLEGLVAESDSAAPGYAAAVEQGKAALVAAEAEQLRSEQERRTAEAERHRWSARAEALSQALDEARARAGARRLAQVEGVLGALLELVEVDEGWEAAFEAAAGDALAAVVVDGYEAARRALAHLARQDAAGAVMALGPGPLAPPLRGLPEGCLWTRDHARSRSRGVQELLDRLLSSSVVVEGGWEAALDVAIAHPELIVVTKSGDRCGGGIWRTGTSATGATGAALEQARDELSRAAGRADQAALAEREAKEAAARARSAYAGAVRSAEANASQSKAARQALVRARSDLTEAEDEARLLSSQQVEVATRLAAEREQQEGLEAVLPGLEAARARLVERTAAVAALRRDFEVRAASIEERRDLLRQRRAQVEQRLARSVAERAGAEANRARLEAASQATAALGTVVRSRLATLENVLEGLRDARRSEVATLRSQGEQLEVFRRERAKVEHQLSQARERSGRAELDETELKARLQLLTENIRRELDCEPASLAGAECPPLPPGTSAASRARGLEREIRLMGPVNPLALEEYAALQERHTFLEEQLHDVQAARRELAKVIKAVDAEIIAVFKAAFDDVAENFANLFGTLFPGGQASLYLTEPSDLLESGVDIEVRPVGKNVRRLSLLSGGERSLVALAFLFAVFRSRPSPFYMMDEVESALDDVNLHRFLDLVHEFRSEAQLLIVSHQKRTMEAADCLYGVTMPPGGSSKVVSQMIEPSAAATT
jgi:chromosome segregation protein